MLYGGVLRDVVNSVGEKASLAVIKERDVAGAEPPPSVAAAMSHTQAVVAIPEKWNMVHTNALIAATAAGARFYNSLCRTTIKWSPAPHGWQTCSYHWYSFFTGMSPDAPM